MAAESRRIIASWNGHEFEVSPSVVRSFEGLTFKAGVKTEEEGGDDEEEKVVSRKSIKPAEVSFTVVLNSYMGCNTEMEAYGFLNDAREGVQAHLYMNGYKVLPCKMMATEATVNEIEIAPSGAWISCKIKLKLQQSEKISTAIEAMNSAAVSGTGGGGSSSNSSSSSTRPGNTGSTDNTGNTDNTGSSTGSLLDHMNDLINQGKKDSAQAKAGK